MNNDFTKWFLICVRDKYTDFKGRARRKEYWMYVLVYFILNTILMLIERILGLPMLLTGILGLALFVPSLAVAIRRLHDVGKSGLWILIALVPLIGFIYLLYLTIKDGQPEPNQWGANPKR